MKYGQTIEWTEFPDIKRSVATSGYDSLEEAKRVAIAWAKECHWTPPKWWQYWRWYDTNIKEN